MSYWYSPRYLVYITKEIWTSPAARHAGTPVDTFSHQKCVSSIVHGSRSTTDQMYKGRNLMSEMSYWYYPRYLVCIYERDLDFSRRKATANVFRLVLGMLSPSRTQSGCVISGGDRYALDTLGSSQLQYLHV